MKKTLVKSLGAICAVGAMATPAFTITSCAGLKVDPEIAYHDIESWKHAIEHISTCKHPTLYLSVNAAYMIQQAANLLLASSQLAIQNNRTYNKNDEYKYQDQIFFVSGSVWNYKEHFSPVDSGFALKYDKLVSSEYGYSDILAKNKSSQTIDLSLGNHMLISNMQDLDLLLDKYDEQRSDYIPFDGAGDKMSEGAYKIIDKVIDMYQQIDPNIKFNFVVNDYHWKLFDYCKSNPDVAKIMVKMHQKADKFYFVSDGAYTWITENKEYKEYRKSSGYITAREQHYAWNKIVSNPIDKACKFYQGISPYFFYNNENYYIHFQASETSTFAPCYLDDWHGLTKESTYKSSSPWLIPSTYKRILLDTNYDNYEKSYLSLFRYDCATKPKFSTLFVGGTKDNFDKNKKNLIWMMPGAFRQGRCDDQVFVECRKILERIKQNYPFDEWNYIYKAHPAMSSDDVINTLKKLFNVDALPNNACIIDTVYPFEYTVSLDLWMVDQGIEDCYHLIDPNTLIEAKPNGIIASFDMQTTSVYAAMSMLASEYGYEYQHLKKLVQKDCFFIPKYFSIPNYSYQYGHDYSNENRKALWDFYLPLYQNNEFIDINELEFVG